MSVISITIRRLFIFGWLPVASLLGREAFNPLDYQWTDDSFTYTDNSIIRVNKSDSGKTLASDLIITSESFIVEATVMPLGLGGTDGKGIVIFDSEDRQYSVVIDDQDDERGEPGRTLIYSVPAGRALAETDKIEPAIGVGVQFYVIVSKDEIVATVDGIELRASNILSPPYRIGFNCQRTGAVFSNLFVSYDLDNDGMNDSWEIQYFGDLDQDETTDYDNDSRLDLEEFVDGTNPIKSDTDDDSFSDGEEYQYGTDPLDRTSYPKISVETALALELTFSTYPNRIYRVEYSSDLEIWQVLPDSNLNGIIGDGSEISIFVSTKDRNNSAQFYRIVDISN